jgi:hypothetical protein
MIGAAVVVIAAATGTAVFLLRDNENATSCVAAPSSVDVTEGTSSQLKTVQIGFTQLGNTVSIGAVLENTSTKVAYRAQVTFAVLGADAKPVSTSNQLALEIPVILPGEQIPVGSWGYADGTVSKVAIAPGQVQWAAPADNLASVTADFVSMARTSEPQSGGISYIASSPYCQALTPRGVAMVFRNSDGTIAGGSFEVGAETCSPGAATGRAMAQSSIPAGIDETKTQVKPFCDFAVGGPKSSGKPFN